jgi:hypothetical protein
MRRNLICFALLAGCLSSCKKSSTDPSTPVLPSYHITCNIDGVPKTFNYKIYSISAFAYIGAAGGGPYLSVGGYNDSLMTEHLNFIILVFSDTAQRVHVNTYLDSGSAAFTEFYYINIRDSLHAGSQVNLSATTPIDNHLVLNITYTDSVSIKGNFSGDVFLNGFTSGLKKTITKGEFYVPFLPL